MVLLVFEIIELQAGFVSGYAELLGLSRHPVEPASRELIRSWVVWPLHLLFPH